MITSANGGRVGVGVTTGTATGAKFTLRKLGVINAVATCLPRVGPVTLGVAFCIEERVGERALWQEIQMHPPSWLVQNNSFRGKRTRRRATRSANFINKTASREAERRRLCA